ncbi:NAD-dependent protein deacetylase of SIR2 family [Streptomyces acidiscabies]|uniref:NAD-dependent protein deacetylase of SIR2 family n=1 Tax=Streptomyces acidiscabies TaxID=42234 RepID=UPI0030CAC4F9
MVRGTLRDTFHRWLDEADAVLVGAGAGLSAAAGYDYGDADRFRELLPALHRLGLRSRYLLGVPLPPDMMWGYWAVHITDIRYGTGANPLYRRLHELVGDRDHWVLTSNVDGLFARNGFAPDRIFTPQGDYGFLQCTTPCTRETWPSAPFLERILAAYDRETGRVRDPGALPVCPNCGGEVFPNVRVGPGFVDDAFMPTGERLAKWLSQFPLAEWLSHSTTDRTTHATRTTHAGHAAHPTNVGRLAKWPNHSATAHPADAPSPTHPLAKWLSHSATDHSPTDHPMAQWPNHSATTPTPTPTPPPTLLALELGAGFNTPGVIRHPLENLVRHTPGARLVRINPNHPEVPADLGRRALSIPVRADDFLVP